MNNSAFVFVCKIMCIIGVIIISDTVCYGEGKRICFHQKSVVRKHIHFTVPINLGFPGNNFTGMEVADSDITYDDQAVLALQAVYSDKGRFIRLVYVAHRAGGGFTDSTWARNNASTLDSLLSDRYACFDVKGAPRLENMGGNWVVQSPFKAYEYNKQRYNIQDKILLFGGSMVALSSTNFVFKHSNIALAHAMYSPLLDLYEQAWKHPWLPTTRRAIAVTFNFSDTTGMSWEPTKVIGWNPCPVPVKIWHGINDRVVSVDASIKFRDYVLRAC